MREPTSKTLFTSRTRFTIRYQSITTQIIFQCIVRAWYWVQRSIWTIISCCTWTSLDFTGIITGRIGIRTTAFAIITSSTRTKYSSCSTITASNTVTTLTSTYKFYITSLWICSIRTKHWKWATGRAVMTFRTRNLDRIIRTQTVISSRTFCTVPQSFAGLVLTYNLIPEVSYAKIEEFWKVHKKLYKVVLKYMFGVKLTICSVRCPNIQETK